MSKRNAIVGATLLFGWLGLAFWLTPSLIRAAYAGESLPVLNRMISGQDTHAVDHYLSDWHRIALWVTVVGAGLVAGAAWLHRAWFRIGSVLQRQAAGVPGAGIGGMAVLALWLGMIGGLAEATTHAVRLLVLHVPTRLNVVGPVFWMSSISAVLALFTIGVLITGISRLVRKPEVRGLIPGAFILLVAVSFSRALESGVHPVALSVLSLGIAARGSGALARWGARGHRSVRRGTAVLAAAVVAWGVGSAVRTRVAARAPAPEPLSGRVASAPNIILLVWDTVRAASLSLYGYERRTTPVLDSLALEGGLVFDRAYATAPWTLPSHASMFTGRWHHELSVGWRTPLDDEFPTIAEVLTEHGYATGGFVANREYTSRRNGLDRGFERFDDAVRIGPQLILRSWRVTRIVDDWRRGRIGDHQLVARRPASDVTDSFVRWASEIPTRPFFAFLNQFDAHDPYLPPEPFDLAFSPRQPRYWLPYYARHTERDLAELRTAYDGCIRYLDAQLGVLVEELDRIGELERTVIIVTSDHGEQFGEHEDDLVRHGTSLYSPALHVPLAILDFRATRSASRRSGPVSVRDIAPTVLRLAGVERHPFPGSSLLRSTPAGDSTPSPPLFAKVTGWPDMNAPTWPAHHGPMYSVIDGPLHYIRGDGPVGESLFDLETDPWEQNDIIATSPRKAARLAGLVDRLVERERAKRRPGR